MIEKIEQIEIDTMKRYAAYEGGLEALKLSFYIRLAEKINEVITQLNRNNIIPY